MADSSTRATSAARGEERIGRRIRALRRPVVTWRGLELGSQCSNSLSGSSRVLEQAARVTAKFRVRPWAAIHRLFEKDPAAYLRVVACLVRKNPEPVN